jgi:hypothetical protein
LAGSSIVSVFINSLRQFGEASLRHVMPSLLRLLPGQRVKTFERRTKPGANLLTRFIHRGLGYA